MITVLDSNDLPAVLADAGFPQDPPPEEPKEDPKPDPKAELDDEEEGEDGLTAREKAELSAKMLKAVGKRVRQRREAEEFAAAQYAERQLAEQRAAQLERELSEIRQKMEPKKDPVESAKPAREQFETDQEYLDAMIAWGVEDGLRRRAQEEAKAAAERRQAQIVEEAKARIAKASELVPDFKAKVIDRAQDILIPMPILQYMERSPLMAEIAYHFADNPDLAESLAKLPPDEQLVTIGKIEATLRPFAEKSAHGDKPSTKLNGTKPSDDTGITPSKARAMAPVITPLGETGSSGLQAPTNIRETIADWSKKNGVNLNIRKRH